MKKRSPVLLLGISLLSACGTLPNPSHREVTLNVRSVTFPASITPTASITVNVEVEFGGCQTFKELRATRTASTLNLTAIGDEIYGSGIGCAGYLGWKSTQYIDPGDPARVNPFEIIVNGKSWGKIEIK